MTRPEMTIDKGLKLIRNSAERASAQSAYDNEVEVYARKLWKLLVEKAGEPKAKDIMRRVMGGKKPGRPGTPQEDMMSFIIPAYILKNAHESDEKIARRLLESDYCVQCGQGMFRIAPSDAPDHPNHPTVERKPISKRLPALKKQVERFRQQMIEDDSLPKEYSPKKYIRDKDRSRVARSRISPRKSLQC
jgi:hypothetical protein